MLGLHHEHVAAVALGDHLVLQVLRSVLSAQVGLERATQPGPLPPQLVADGAQLRAGVIHHLARRIDLVARLGDLALEGRHRRARLIEQRVRRSHTPDGVPGVVHRLEKRGECQEPKRLQRTALDGERAQDSRKVVARP